MTVTGPHRAIKAINGCRRLEPRHAHAMLAMVEWMDWDSFSLYPSLARLQDALRASRSTVVRRIDELESMGAISVVRGGGRGRTNRIILNVEWLEGGQPSLFGDQPTAQPTGTPDAGKGVTQMTPFSDEKRCQTGAEKVSNRPVKGVTWVTPKHQRTQIPPPPHAHASGFEPVRTLPAGGGRGGDSQTVNAKDTPAATSARRVAEIATQTTRKSTDDTPSASEAINRSRANPVVEALVALSVARDEAERLAALPHVTLAVVAFVAESIRKSKTPINRPARWVARLVRLGPAHLEGWSGYERRLQSTLIASARVWAFSHSDDAVYGQFIQAACLAIAPHFGEDWNRTIAEGNLHPSVIRPDARPVEVLASLAASCGVDLEIPTDTLRMPVASAPVSQLRSQAL